MTARRLVSALALALVPVACLADPQIAWTSCPPTLVGPGAAALGDRLQCGTLRAPLDHVAPDGRQIDVAVVRVRAMSPRRRQGAIFFNKGGPGANPAALLRSIAVGWSRTAADDPRDGAKRLLAERFDLVAVIPRGLEPGWALRCVTGLPPRHAFLPTHLDDANWQLAIEDAQAVADACTAVPEARYASTEQHVHDMDMVRRILGDATLNFYGISYGGKVGAWYAAIYPAHTGRMLLDSSMIFTHDFRTALEASLNARRAFFLDEVLAPLLKAPLHYGLTDPLSVSEAVETLPARARAAWFHVLDQPDRLAAALRLSEWIRQDGISGAREFDARIRRATFSPDPDTHRAIRWAATQLASLYVKPRPTTPQFNMGQDGDSVRQAVACNDSTWYLSDVQIRAMAERNAAAYLINDGEEILEQLVCRRWGTPGARQPDLEPLAHVPPFLLLQSEKDTATPMAGAKAILARFGNARLLVAKGSAVHGLFNFTASACVERAAARYLLDGTVGVDEASRTLDCDAKPIHPLADLPAPVPTPTLPSPSATPAPITPSPTPVHDET
jgi:pimeloyl-ACP methyl ester carboxylesterase